MCVEKFLTRLWVVWVPITHQNKHVCVGVCVVSRGKRAYFKSSNLVYKLLIRKSTKCDEFSMSNDFSIEIAERLVHSVQKLILSQIFFLG